MSTQGHPAAPLLQELADEAKVNAEPWRAFCKRDSVGAIIRIQSMRDLLNSTAIGQHVERRPKTVRVCGEVPEEAMDLARSWQVDGALIGTPEIEKLTSALLSLVEESER